MAFVKRRRFREPVFAPRARRQIEKVQKNVSLALTGTVQSDSILFTVTDPVTITGLRWDFTATPVVDSGSGSALWWWALVISRENIVVSTLVTSDGNSPYVPEEHVLVAGTYSTGDIAQGPAFIAERDGVTKTMRKMKGGDTVHFISKGSAATQQCVVNGVVTFFAKH